VAAQRLVHAPVEDAEIARVEPEQLRPDLLETGAHAGGVSRQVGGTERADLAIAGDALIGLNRHHGRVEHGDDVSTRPFVAAFVQRQVDLIGADGGDFHLCAAAGS
jgi:hypothetical protein